MAMGIAVVIDRLISWGKTFFPWEHGYAFDCVYSVASLGYDVRATYGYKLSTKYTSTAYLDDSMFIQDNFNNDLIVQQFESLSWALHNYMIVREGSARVAHWQHAQPGVKELMEIAGVEVRAHTLPVLGRQYWLVKPEKWAVIMSNFYDGMSAWDFEMWQEYIAAHCAGRLGDERIKCD